MTAFLPSLTATQGAALIWLREIGGQLLLLDPDQLSAPLRSHIRAAPFALESFEALFFAGLVGMRSGNDYREIFVNEAGARFDPGPAAQHYFQQVERRFDD